MKEESPLPSCVLIGQLGGKEGGVSGRIKDFQIISTANEEETPQPLLVATAGSDGAIRLWTIGIEELVNPSPPAAKIVKEKTNGTATHGNITTPHQIGRLIGEYDTNNRITCMISFILRGQAEDDGIISQEKFDYGSSNNDEEEEEEEEEEDDDDEVEDDSE
jgi:protein MAK11